MTSRRFALIAALALLVTACGDATSQTGGSAQEPPTTAASPGTTPEPSPEPSPEGTASPTGDDGEDPHEGMDHGEPMMAASAGEAAEGQDPDHQFDVLVGNHFEFRPAAFEVSAGDVVTFSITNDGDLEHEFVLGTPQMQQKMADEMAQMQDDGHAHAHADMPNAVTVHGGKTATLTWRFTEAGTVLIGCHVQGHWDAGMKGEVRVS